MDFSKTPIISQKIWLSAYRFAKADIPMEKTRQAHNKSLIYCTARGQKYTKREMGLFLKHTWKSFDRFTESLKIHCINFINNQDWISSTCTCRYFQKRFICKHILGIAIIRKLAKVPSHIRASRLVKKLRLVGQKRSKRPYIETRAPLYIFFSFLLTIITFLFQHWRLEYVYLNFSP